MTGRFLCACTQVRPLCTETMTQEDLLCDACRAGECVRQRQEYDRRDEETYQRMKRTLALPPPRGTS